MFSGVKDPSLKQRLLKQIEKIKTNPSVGKPMKYERQGTRELYVSPFRLSYLYLKNEGHVYILDLYHKKRQ